MMSHSEFISAEKEVFSRVCSSEMDLLVLIVSYAGMLRDYAEKRRYEISKDELMLFLLRVKGGVRNGSFKGIGS